MATTARRPEAYLERRPRAPFTEEHEDFRQAVRRWVANELAPHADEWERAHFFPTEVFRRCAEQGYLGLGFPEAHGAGRSAPRRAGRSASPARSTRPAWPAV